MQYPIFVHPDDDGGYRSEVPSLPGCASQGDTLDETIRNTREAIEQWLAYMRDKGESAPPAGDIVLAVEVPA